MKVKNVDIDADVEPGSIKIRPEKPSMEGKISVEGPSIDVEPVKVKVKGPSVPEVPEIKGNLDVEADLPDFEPSIKIKGDIPDIPKVEAEMGGKADIPGIEIKGNVPELPKIEASVDAPELKVEGELPKLKTEGDIDIGINVPSISGDIKGLNIETPDFPSGKIEGDIKGDLPSIEIPKAEVSLPAGPELPSAEIKGELKGPEISSSAQVPKAELKTKKAKLGPCACLGKPGKIGKEEPYMAAEAGGKVSGEVEGIDVGVEGPKGSVAVDVDSPEIKGKKVKASGKPKMSLGSCFGKAKPPSARGDLSADAGVEGTISAEPHLKVEGADIAGPSAEISLPEGKAEVDIESPEVKVKGGKVSGKPKMKFGPCFGKGKDVEVEGEYKPSKVEVKGPSVSGEVSAASPEMSGDISVEAPKAKIKGEKPKSKLGSCFGKPKGPEVEGEYDPAKLDVKGPEVRGEVGVSSAEVTGDIDVESPDVKVKPRKPKAKIGSCFGKPKSPEVEGKYKPEIDVEGHKAGAEVSVRAPEVEGHIDVDSPDIKIKREKPKSRLGPCFGKAKGEVESEYKPGNVSVKGPDVGAGTSVMSPDISAEARVKSPDIEGEIDIESPKVEVKGKKVSGKPKVNLGSCFGKPKEPKIEGTGAQIQGEVPAAKVEVKGDIPDIPKVKAEIGGKADIPEIEMQGSVPKLPEIKATIGSPELKTEGDVGVGVSAPSISGDIKGDIPKAEVTVPSGPVLPSTEIKGEIKSPALSGSAEIPKAEIKTKKAKLGPCTCLGKSGKEEPYIAAGGGKISGEVESIEAGIERPKGTVSVEVDSPEMKNKKVKASGKPKMSLGSCFGKGKPPSVGEISTGLDVDVKPDQPDFEISAEAPVPPMRKGKKFKVKSPDIDMNMGSIDVNADVPEVGGIDVSGIGIKAGGADINGSLDIPEFEGRIKSPHVKSSIEIPEVEGKISMPGIKGSGEIQGYGGKITMPDVKGNTDIPGFSGKISMPEVNGNVDIPSFGSKIDMPDLNGKADIQGFRGKVDMPEMKGSAEMPGFGGKVDMPEIKGSVGMPGFGGKVDMPEIKGSAEMPGFGGKVDMPEIKGKFDMPEIKGSFGGKVDMPEIEGSVGMPDFGGKVDMPEIKGFGGKVDMPQIKGKFDMPEIKEIKGKFDMPEVKGKVDMPEIKEIKGKFDMPEVKGKVDMPEIKGFGGKIDMPEVKGKVDMPEIKGKVDMPEFKGKFDMPEIKGFGGKIDMPEVKGSVGMPSFGGKVDMPEIKEIKGKVNMSEMKGKVDTPGVMGSVGIPGFEGKVDMPEMKGKVDMPGTKGKTKTSGFGGKIDVPKMKGKVEITGFGDKGDMPETRGTGAKVDMALTEEEVEIQGFGGKVSMPELKGKTEITSTESKINMPVGKGKGKSRGKANLPKGKGSAEISGTEGEVDIPLIKGTVKSPGIDGKVDLPKAKGKAVKADIQEKKSSVDLPAAEGKMKAKAEIPNIKSGVEDSANLEGVKVKTKSDHITKTETIAVDSEIRVPSLVTGNGDLSKVSSTSTVVTTDIPLTKSKKKRNRANRKKKANSMSEEELEKEKDQPEAQTPSQAGQQQTSVSVIPKLQGTVEVNKCLPESKHGTATYTFSGSDRTVGDTTIVSSQYPVSSSLVVSTGEPTVVSSSTGVNIVSSRVIGEGELRGNIPEVSVRPGTVPIGWVIPPQTSHSTISHKVVVGDSDQFSQEFVVPHTQSITVLPQSQTEHSQVMMTSRPTEIHEVNREYTISTEAQRADDVESYIKGKLGPFRITPDRTLSECKTEVQVIREPFHISPDRTEQHQIHLSPDTSGDWSVGPYSYQVRMETDSEGKLISAPQLTALQSKEDGESRGTKQSRNVFVTEDAGGRVIVHRRIESQRVTSDQDAEPSGQQTQIVRQDPESSVVTRTEWPENVTTHRTVRIRKIKRVRVGDGPEETTVETEYEGDPDALNLDSVEGFQSGLTHLLPGTSGESSLLRFGLGQRETPENTQTVTTTVRRVPADLSHFMQEGYDENLENILGSTTTTTTTRTVRKVKVIRRDEDGNIVEFEDEEGEVSSLPPALTSEDVSTTVSDDGTTTTTTRRIIRERRIITSDLTEDANRSTVRESASGEGEAGSSQDPSHATH
ncbi:neuroblast differentiation-associated protein AHNAK-like [Penaeus indicus]|uniref:neuroblast differentiation-associated protein AHNAK-like n=1 Tax=Penaeus indicus TaxID=29960 RepID=UPI00300D0F88